MKYHDEILLCGNGAGFMAVECLAGIYRAFEEADLIPGHVCSSSGATLFSALYYSKKGIDWIDGLMDKTKPSDFVQFSTIGAAKTLINKAKHIFNNDAVYDLLKVHMTGNASMRVITSVTRNSDWSSHMRHVTPGWTLAATSIPFVFKPVKIGGELWSDGGVLNNLPVPSLKEAKKYERIFVFVAPPTKFIQKDNLVCNLLDLLQAVMERELEQLREMGFFDLPNVTVIRPLSDHGGSLLSWSPGFALRQRTYELAKEILQ